MSSIDSLIDQMKPKRELEELRTNKRNTSEKNKNDNNIHEIDINYYAILGLKKDASALEIKRAYQKKLKKLHPDKIEQTHENKLKYKLVREAGDTLTNVHKRKAYDMQRKIDTNSKDFISTKNSFKEFMKLQEQNMTDDDRKIAKLNFEKTFNEMNIKHGYNENGDNSMNKEEYNRRMEDLINLREQEEAELEIEQDNPFDGRSFNSNEFNKMFERKKRRDDEKRKKGGLAKYNDSVSASNDLEDNLNGVSINNYDSLYSDTKFDDYNANYAGINSGMINISDNISDNNSDDDVSIDSLDDNIEDTYDSHNKGVSKDKLDVAMKKLMAERNTQDSKFENMVDADFGSAINDKYGISKDFGFMIGDSLFGQQKNFKNNDLKNDMLKVYKELTEE